MSKDMQNKVLRYYVQNQKSVGNGYTRQRTIRNWQGTDLMNSEDLSEYI